MQHRIITLLSDFGLKDPYVAEMKAVILSIFPQATMVDISHEVDKFDVRMGAFVLASAAPYFPKGTVHVAVVDPGVGTKRRPIIMQTEHSHFVGPDNGLLILAASKEGLQHVYFIENPRYVLPEVSKTFHGRDVFAPVSAHLAKGCAASEFGREVEDFVVPDFAEPRVEGKTVLGEVLHVDDFGNIITNISSEMVEKVAIREGEAVRVEMGKGTVSLRLCSAYGDVPAGSALAIVSSHGFLEISVNQGSAAEWLKVKRGDSILLQP
jgi:S-adenosylmethionine hydrolase